ncbi:MAG TPA: mechanosensitive ion channel [Dokdonella sp.]|nr:mechanosensitive ion channel [Dokdonella sp.]
MLNSATFSIASIRSAGIAVVLLLANSMALAQASGSTPGDPPLNADEIRARIESMQSRTEVVASDKQLTIENLQAALARIESAESSRKQAAEYAKALTTAPARIAELSARLEKPVEEVKDAGPDRVDLAEAQLQMASLQIRAVSLRSERRALQESLRSMATRRLAAREDLTALREQAEQKPESVPSDASQMLIDSSRIKAEAIRQDLSARIEKTEQEILSLPTREAIAGAQQSLIDRELRQIEAATSSLGRRMDARDQEDTQAKLDAAEAAVREWSNGPEAMLKIAQETADLRKSMAEISGELRRLWSVKDRTYSQLGSVALSRKYADQILAFGRIGEEHGRMLRDVAKQLPSQSALDRRIAERQAAVVDARVLRFRTEQRLSKAGANAEAVDRLMAGNGIADTPGNRAAAKKLLVSRRQALGELLDLQARQVESLAEASSLDTELLQRSTQLRSLLNQRLLWLPSASPIDASWGKTMVAGVAGLLTAESIAGVLPSARQSLAAHPLRTPFLLASAGFLFFLRKRLSKRLATLAGTVGTRADRMVLTLSALLVTVLLAMPIPLAVGLAGSLLLEPDSPTSLSSALGTGLINVGIVLFILGLFRTMCRHHGLFVSHFGWDSTGSRRLGLALWSVSLALAPAAFLSGVAQSNGDPALVDGVGRLALVVSSIALAIFTLRVFRPVGGALTTSLSRRGLIWRTRHVWFWTLLSAPLALAGLSMAGYHSSANELQARLVSSGWVLLSIVIFYQIAMRGVLVAGRQAAYKQAEVRQARRIEDSLAGSGADGSGEGSPIPHEDPEIDVVTVSQQTRAMLRAASGILLVVFLFGIWSSIVPALGVFNDIVLWSNVSTTATGQLVSEVTLAHFLLSILLLGLTFFAARNLPGFLEIVVLHRLELDSGTRYAYVTICRYGILMIGIIIAFSRIGVDWSKLQWIVAALGVGLGFGLQEIVANFISGIIILFERPVRVGDLISIDNTVGTVTRIQIRAITITDPDNFEVLVPNKTFITGTVKNWSLTTPITRLVVKVGIAYGSDVALAQKTLLDIAAADDNVLDTPAPTVLFLGFGDSSLDLELRVFVGRIEHRLPTLHNLHSAVHAGFASAGIEIPFPQRDLHVRSGLEKYRGDVAETEPPAGRDLPG